MVNNFKIRKIKFEGHDILGNIELDFCDASNKPVDTVIIAGENGSGKSTLIDCLYNITSQNSKKVKYKVFVEVQDMVTNEISILETFYNESAKTYFVKNNQSLNTILGSSDFNEKYPLNAIFSDVDINFKSKNISSVTSVEVDTISKSQKSSEDLAYQIKQLLIDIKAMDAEDFTKLFENTKSKMGDLTSLEVNKRFKRFNNAFEFMFDDLKFDRIENKLGYKDIVFKKTNKDVSIDQLSSGEKQIVYRNSFLLKDVNAMQGAFVFIDEPEISLHPKWQEKILDNYKRIFTDDNGTQTSQIFVVTHSPFVIHNKYRANDKVILLQRDSVNNIIISDKAAYYKCNSIELVQDAFSINLNNEYPTVYLAGRTDEKYFKKCLEVFEYTNLPFEFKWVGYLDEKNQEVNTGDDALQKAVHLLISKNLSYKNVCLFDYDAKKQESTKNNVIVRNISKNSKQNIFKKGIENALDIENVEERFYTTNTKVGDYGEPKIITEFKKMDYCNYICSKDSKDLKGMFVNLKAEIDKIIDLFKQI